MLGDPPARPSLRHLAVYGFGTYDADRPPRVRVLLEGLRALGANVLECNEPIQVSTTERVGAARNPFRMAAYLGRIARAWIRLWRRARRLEPPDVVVVGYMGHLDVRLARRLWPRAVVVLDHLVSLEDTARDRQAGSRLLLKVFARLDAAAIRVSHVVCVDTEEHLALVPPDRRDDAVVVPVGASTDWFQEPSDPNDGLLRVVFFGLYIPLQGAPVIGEAIGILADDDRIAFTMIGSGQDFEATRRAAGSNPRVDWIEWVDGSVLPSVVHDHAVCLGIFGSGPKAMRVVPNKVYQGAAAGCVVVTSDTPPQRRAFGDTARYVPPGDGTTLAATLSELAGSPQRVATLRRASSTLAASSFTSDRVVAPLADALVSRAGGRDR